MMYKDLITQITKYLRPKILHYPTLEIEKMNDKDGTIKFHFYLISRINDDLEFKIYFDSLYIKIAMHCYRFTVIRNYIDKNLYFQIVREIYPECQTDKYYSPIVMFNINENMELRFFRPYFQYVYNQSDLSSLSKSNIKEYNCGYPINIYSNNKFDKKSIKLMEEGFEIINKIGRSDLSKLEEKNLTDKEKKYIKFL